MGGESLEKVRIEGKIVRNTQTLDSSWIVRVGNGLPGEEL